MSLGKDYHHREMSSLGALLHSFRPDLVFRTIVRVVASPHAFLAEIRMANWDKKSHPIAFLIVLALILSVLDPLVTERLPPKWFETVCELDESHKLAFIRAFPFDDSDLASLEDERLFPDESSASMVIRETVSSLLVSDITHYLSETDPILSQAVASTSERIQTYKEYEAYASGVLFTVLWTVSAVVIHFILRTRETSLWLAFVWTVYWQGAWLIFLHIFVWLGRFTLPKPLNLSAASDNILSLGLLFLVVTHGVWFFGLLYQRALWRRVVAIVVSLMLSIALIGVVRDGIWRITVSRHNNTMHAEPPKARVLNRTITPAAR